MDITGFLNSSGLLQPVIIWAAAFAVIIVLLRVSNVFRYIPNNQVGIVEKLWSAKGSIEDGFIALNGEAGYEPEVLRGGLHVFFPFMYRIHKSDLVTVGQGKIAYVFARDGMPLGPSQVLGANDTDDKSDFQDARRVHPDVNARIQKKIGGQLCSAACTDVAATSHHRSAIWGCKFGYRTTPLRIVEMEYGLHRVS